MSKIQLASDENCLRTFYHHPTVYLFRLLKIIFSSFPFYFLTSLFRDVLSIPTLTFFYFFITFGFLLFILYDALLFFLDRLILTNKRIIHIDWSHLFQRYEHEAILEDIQDIETEENGVLSYLPFFDYGLFKLTTASNKATVIFESAPNPEGIKHLVYQLLEKPNTIDCDPQLEHYDSKRKTDTQPDRHSNSRE